MQLETRAIEGLEVRAEEGEAPVITGYAAVFNERAEIMPGFVEIIAPGAFDLQRDADVRALFNHNTSVVLGRTKAGTLSLATDARGLRADITPPDTEEARAIVASVRRGDISGMSFGFRARSDKWEKADGKDVRTLLDVDLFEVSLATFPAYPQTEAAVRSRDAAHEDFRKLSEKAAARKRALREALLG